MQKPLLSIKQAAERLGVCTKTVRNYTQSGRLTAYRLGDHLIRLDPAEVESLLRPIPNALTGRGDAA